MASPSSLNARRLVARVKLRWSRYLNLLLMLSMPGSREAFCQESSHGISRPVSVVDAIEMTRLADPLYLSGGSSRGRVAQFSPDLKHFVVLLTKGNLQHNTNEFSLLLYKTSEAFNTPSPDVLLTMASSSNREAIKEVKWLEDNETVAFLGENPAEFPQVYRFNIRTRRLERMTHHPTAIVNYDISANGREVVFVAEPPATKIVDTEKTRREGIVVTTQEIPDILSGDGRVPSWRDSK